MPAYIRAPATFFSALFGTALDTGLGPARPAAPTRRPAPARLSLRRLVALHRERRALAALDAHMLRDIGVTDVERDAELAKPLWDVPQGWRR